MGFLKIAPTATSTAAPTLLKTLTFPSVSSDDWSANTEGAYVVKTVDGDVWRTYRNTNCDTFGPDGASGLVIGNSTTAGGSRLDIGLSTLLGAYDPETDHLIVLLTATFASAGTSTAVNMFIRSQDETNGLSVVLKHDGANYGIRSGAVYASTLKEQSPLLAVQPGAPTSARLQLDAWKSSGMARGDMDAGSVIPAIDALAEIGEASRWVSVSDVVGTTDLTTPELQLRLNPGAGGTMTLIGLTVYKATR